MWIGSLRGLFLEASRLAAHTKAEAMPTIITIDEESSPHLTAPHRRSPASLQV
jgi:hypothetical protein